MSEFLFVCLGVFLTSLFWWSKAPVPFEVPKVIFFQWFVRILTLVFGASFLIRRRIWRVNLKLLTPVLIFVVWATTVSLFGSNIPKSFTGNYFRIDGLITLYELVGFSVLVSYFWKEKFKKMISLTFFASSTLLSLLAIAEILTHRFGLGSAATFGNPVFLAGYLAVAIPFIFYLFKSTGRKIYLILLIVQVLATILIGAISSILTLVVFAVIYLIFLQKKVVKLILIPLLVGASFLTVLSWSTYHFYLKNPKTLVAEGRERIYQSVVRGVLKRPILGYGWANVDYAFETGIWPMKFYHDVYVDKAHSEILEILVTTGIPGLLIYLYFLYMFLKQLIIKYRKSTGKLWNFTLVSIILLYLFHSQTNVISIAEEIIFWLVLGVTLSASR